MGILINGKWQTTKLAKHDKKGRFVRPQSQFDAWIKADGSIDFPTEPNRYHLYFSYACPWAHRALIFRSLKGLQNVISASAVSYLMLDNGWEFSTSNDDTTDPNYHLHYLYQIYQKADKHYSGRVTVPVLWDKKTHTIVNNESADIIRMFNSEFNTLTERQQDYYPSHLRQDIDELNNFIYQAINNGVYRCGFASTQIAYEEAVDELFDALDNLEKRLANKSYLFGDQLTETDWRLFTTLIRFDAVYVGHFKCNLKRIADYQNLARYLHQLYHYPDIKETVNFAHIKNHYYQSHLHLNPTGIVPKGPKLDYLN